MVIIIISIYNFLSFDLVVREHKFKDVYQDVLYVKYSDVANCHLVKSKFAPIVEFKDDDDDGGDDAAIFK